MFYYFLSNLKTEHSEPDLWLPHQHPSLYTALLLRRKVASMKPSANQNLPMMTLPQSANLVAVEASSHQRWEVVCAVVVVSFLTILARVGISAAKVEMAHDLGISDLTFGLVFGAFALGYAVFMVPCGLLADRWGPRKSLTLSVFFWSLFTLLTGLVSGVAALLSIRFLFGLAEAGVYPQATRALHNWTLPRERGLALGLLNMGSRLGAAFGLALTPLCVVWLGWRESFVWLGIIGGIWAAIWFWWFHDRPEIKLNKHESNVLLAGDEKSGAKTNHRIPWRAFLSSRNFYLIHRLTKPRCGPSSIETNMTLMARSYLFRRLIEPVISMFTTV
jgi:MFS family permease